MYGVEALTHGRGFRLDLECPAVVCTRPLPGECLAHQRMAVDETLVAPVDELEDLRVAPVGPYDEARDRQRDGVPTRTA